MLRKKVALVNVKEQECRGQEEGRERVQSRAEVCVGVPLSCLPGNGDSGV
jgi:hypothetical protein